MPGTLGTGVFAIFFVFRRFFLAFRRINSIEDHFFSALKVLRTYRFVNQFVGVSLYANGMPLPEWLKRQLNENENLLTL